MASLAGVSTISFGAPFFFPRWDPRAMRKESSEVILGNPDCACIDYRCAHGNCIGEVTVDQVFAKILERLQHSP
jgi:hypothetical protein